MNINRKFEEVITMIKVAHELEVAAICSLPTEVRRKAVEIAKILDENYGLKRDPEVDLGGYILIAQEPKDLEAISELIDFNYTIPEFVDLINCNNGEIYTSSLMLLSSDYSISLLIPLRLTPMNLLECMDAKVEGRPRA